MAKAARDRAGLRNTLITIEQISTQTKDAAGEQSLVWAAMATAWAEVVAEAGGEIVEADRPQGRQAYRMTIPFRGDVTTRMRVNWGGRLFGIESVVDPDGRRVHTLLRCREAVAA